jgi:succinate dehydrogenase / fumarate reductase cytochrome b subunit
MTVLRAPWRSHVGRKITMAVTGILLVGFLLSHMASNILVFKDPAALDAYAAWLRGFGPLLWVARLGLLALAGLHVWSALALIRANREARPVGYARHALASSTWGARSMRVGGFILLFFIVFHILHFTTGTVHPDFVPGRVGGNLIAGFRLQPAVAAFYIVAMVALWLHLTHGVWSFFQTLGLNHPRWNRSRLVLAWALAIVIAGGLLVIPVGVLAGWAGQ